MDIEKFIEGLHDYLGKQFSPLLLRLAAAEKLCGEQAAEIQRLGKTVESLPAQLEEFKSAVATETSLTVAEVKGLTDHVGSLEREVQAIQGRPTLEDVQPAIDDAVAKAVAAIEIPKPEDGKSVTLEDVQPAIDDAVAKAVAAIPRAHDGRDAIHLDVLPSIDTTKTYDRNTYARHAGGLWRSFETTHAMRGWECIVRGIDTFAVQDDGNRMIVLAATLSDGTESAKAIKYPTLLDQGVYRSDSTYEHGDVVSYGGSMWIAQVDQPKAAPGLTEEWRLSVKRGAPGKAGTPPSAARGPVRLGD